MAQGRYAARKSQQINNNLAGIVPHTCILLTHITQIRVTTKCIAKPCQMYSRLVTHMTQSKNMKRNIAEPCQTAARSMRNPPCVCIATQQSGQGAKHRTVFAQARRVSIVYTAFGESSAVNSSSK